MSSCKSCNTNFRFMDVLKGANPASVKCSSCSERIKSSYGTLFFSVILFLLILTPLWSMKLDLGASGGLIKLAAIGLLGLVFEYGYFYFLSKGTIKSNLNTGEN